MYIFLSGLPEINAHLGKSSQVKIQLPMQSLK